MKSIIYGRSSQNRLGKAWRNQSEYSNPASGVPIWLPVPYRQSVVPIEFFAVIHFVRVGAMGQIGRFQSMEGIAFKPTTRVILRTSRGLEIGEVLSLDNTINKQAHDGKLLRAMTDSDELLAARLDKNRNAAYEACACLLAEHGSTSVLLDVEHLFDGQGLYFYFLGETDDLAEALTAELAKTYNAEARFEQFADALSEGCGPGCGTSEAEGGACGGACSSCSIATKCATTKSSA